MKIIGKILFFNADSGQGMIMTADKKKINFSVSDWDDFDTMPSLGLEVRFIYQNSTASSIVSISYIEEDSQKEKIPEIIEEETKVEIKKVSYTEKTAKKEKQVHFESDKDIKEIGTNEELEEELGQREESVTVTMNLSKAVSNYFAIIEKNIEKRLRYKKVDGRLNYVVIRRFLWTTFNNLCEIDLHILTPKIKALSDDLKTMASIHDDFQQKVKYPVLAYEEVFLSCQAEYNKIRIGAEKTIQRINQLKGSEKHLDGALKIKKEELAKEINTDEFDVMQGELKSLNGAYVDVVHMMAELDERYKHDMKLLNEFEKEYKEDFFTLFETDAKKYQKDFSEILSAQAFTLDAQLWHEAKTSKGLHIHFHKSGINGEFNTITYLKYYLDTQDASMASKENKKLFELYDYLVSLQRDHIMIILNDSSDALEFENTIKREDKIYKVKAFIDEKSALKWAIKHSVQILILENNLLKMDSSTFLQYYKKYVLVIPKIILLGNNKNSDLYTIHKLLPRSTSSRVIVQNIKELLSDKKA